MYYTSRMEMRQRLHLTSDWERARFVLMWAEGMSLRAIARHTGASVTTVYRWIRRWQYEGHVNTRPRIFRSLNCHPKDSLFMCESTKHTPQTSPSTYLDSKPTNAQWRNNSVKNNFMKLYVFQKCATGISEVGISREASLVNRSELPCNIPKR